MAAGRLDVLMGLDAAEFTKGLTKAEYETRKFQQGVQKSFANFGNLLKGAFAAFTVQEIVQGFASIVSSLDDMDEAAQALGTTAVALSEFRRSALDSGVSAEKFDASLTKLSVKLVDAASGGKESIAAFKTLGIEIRNSSGQIKTTDEILGQVADKFASYADGAEKTALAVALFGKAGAAMIPFLNQGADGLRKFSGVTQESVEAAKQLQAQFDTLKAGLSALGIEIATSIIPFLSKMIQEFLAAKDAAGGFFGALKLLAKQSADTLADPGAKIQELGAELEKLQATAEESHGLFGNVDNAERIASLQNELKFLKELQRNRALANAGTPYGNEGRLGLGRAPVIPDQANDKKPKIDEAKRAFDAYAEQLQNVIEKEQQLSKVQQVSNDLLRDKYKNLLPEQKQYLLGLAAEIDANTEYEKKIKHLAEAERERNQAALAMEERIDKLTGRTADREALATLEELDRRLSVGTIELEDYIKAQKTFWDGTTEGAKEADQATEQFGLTFASAIGDFITNPQSGKTFFQALLEDLLQLTTQMLVVQPIAKMLKDTLSSMTSSGGSSGYLGLLGQLFGGGKDLSGPWGMTYASGTEFVPRDGLAMVHRGERVVTAEDNRSGNYGGRSVVINQSFAPGTSRETVNQAAAAAAQRLQMANRRNN